MRTAASDQRRVLQCTCGATIAWRGEEGAIAAGWGRARSPSGEVLADAWRCPDCRPKSPGKTETSAPSTLSPLVPATSIEIVLRHLAHPKSIPAIDGALWLQREIVRLRTSQDDLAVACANAHIEAIRGLIEQHRTRKPRGRAMGFWQKCVGQQSSTRRARARVSSER